VSALILQLYRTRARTDQRPERVSR
jgi:hypothetical protein